MSFTAGSSGEMSVAYDASVVFSERRDVPDVAEVMFPQIQIETSPFARAFSRRPQNVAAAVFVERETAMATSKTASSEIRSPSSIPAKVTSVTPVAR